MSLQGVDYEARCMRLEAEVERSHKAILALTGENERLRADLEDARKAAGIMGTATHAHNPRLLVEQIERIKAENERLRAAKLARALAQFVRAVKYTSGVSLEFAASEAAKALKGEK